MSNKDISTPPFDDRPIVEKIRVNAIAAATSHGFDHDTADELADVIIEAREKMKQVWQLQTTLTPTDRSVDQRQWLAEQLQAHANAMFNESVRQMTHVFDCMLMASHRLKR